MGVVERFNDLGEANPDFNIRKWVVSSSAAEQLNMQFLAVWVTVQDLQSKPDA